MFSKNYIFKPTISLNETVSQNNLSSKIGNIKKVCLQEKPWTSAEGHAHWQNGDLHLEAYAEHFLINRN